MMRFRGHVYKNNSHWLAEIPSLGYMTQGRTKKEALQMIADLVETMVDKDGFTAQVHAAGEERFEVASEDVKALTALLLRRKREWGACTVSGQMFRLRCAPLNMTNPRTHCGTCKTAGRLGRSSFHSRGLRVHFTFVGRSSRGDCNRLCHSDRSAAQWRNLAANGTRA